MSRATLLLAAALAAAGCAPAAPPDPPGAGAADGGAAVPAEDAGPPGPAALPVSLAEAASGDAAVPLARDGGATLVDPASSFRVEVAARIVDARLSLLDSQDAVVPADGSAEVGPRSRFALAPAARLRPGSGYALRLEGALGSESHDEKGRAYLPVTFPLRTSGDPPAPPARGKRARRRR